MKSKTIYYIIGISLFFVIIVPNVGFLKSYFSWMYFDTYENCDVVLHGLVLKSVNGIEDIDTGLFSGGTIYKKNLLFSDGRIIEFSRTELDNVDLILNASYEYSHCLVTPGGLRIFSNPFSVEEKRLKLESEEK